MTTNHSPLKLLALASVSGLSLLAGCNGAAGATRESPWAQPLRLEGARNETLAAVADDTRVPSSVLFALAYQQSRFEDPDLLADNPMEDEVLLDDPELEAADFDWNDASRIDEPEQEVDTDDGVEGLEDFSDEIAADPATAEYEQTEDLDGFDELAGLPDDIDTTSEESSEDELADAHLDLDSSGVFYLTSEQVTWAAQRLSLDEQEIRDDLEANARATAELLTADIELDGSTVASASHRRWEDAMVRFVGLDPSDDAGRLAREELRAILEDGFDTTTFDGEQLMMVQAGGAALPDLGWQDDGAVDGEPETDTGSGVTVEALGGIEWIAASSNNYSSGRGGSRIRYVVIHDIEGTMPGAIGVFRNPSSQASAHYIIRARDGHIVQMVREADRAWHAGHFLFNSSSIGIEHEGFADRPRGGGFYTQTQYQASARLVCDIVRRYDIPVDRRHITGHGNIPPSRSSTTLCSDSAANRGQCGGASRHYDPGRFWDWRLYMSLIARCASGRPAPAPSPRPRPVREQRAISTGWGGQRVVVDGEGGVHVFGVDAAHRLVETVRQGATGDFSRFRVIDAGGALSGFPAAVASNGRIIVAVRGSDDRVHVVRRSAAGAWEPSVTLAGLQINAMPSLFVNRDGRAEVFVRGDNNELWHAAERAEAGDFGQWWSLGGNLRSMPTVIADAQGRPRVFTIGDSSGHIFTRIRTSPLEWRGWTFLSARGNAPVSPVLMPDGRLGVFTRDSRGRLVSEFTETNGTTWRTPRTVGGILTSNVVAQVDARGRVNVFGRGTDGAIYRIVRNIGGRWGSFARLGGRVTMGPAVVRTSVGLEVFTVGRNRALYHAYQTRGTRSGWAGWHGHGGRLGWM